MSWSLSLLRPHLAIWWWLQLRRRSLDPLDPGILVQTFPKPCPFWEGDNLTGGEVMRTSGGGSWLQFHHRIGHNNRRSPIQVFSLATRWDLFLRFQKPAAIGLQTSSYIHTYHTTHWFACNHQSNWCHIMLILRLPIPIDGNGLVSTRGARRHSGIGMPTTQGQVTQKEDDIRTATMVQLIKGCNKKTALVITKWLQISGVQCWWTNSLVLMRVVVFFCLSVFCRVDNLCQKGGS